MFMLRRKAKHQDRITLVVSHDKAINLAREFVGEHNATDGCSTPAHEDRKGFDFKCRRGTSFGERYAHVAKISVGDEVQL